MSLAQAFAKGNGRRAKWQGSTVNSLIRLDVNTGDRIAVTGDVLGCRVHDQVDTGCEWLLENRRGPAVVDYRRDTG